MFNLNLYEFIIPVCYNRYSCNCSLKLKWQGGITVEYKQSICSLLRCIAQWSEHWSVKPEALSSIPGLGNQITCCNR